MMGTDTLGWVGLAIDGKTVFSGFFFVLGLGLLAASAKGFYDYWQITRRPYLRATEVSEAGKVAMRGAIAESTPTVESPFSGEPAALCAWYVDEYSGTGEERGWLTVGQGIAHDGFTISDEGYEIPVEAPAGLYPRADVEFSGRGKPIVTVSSSEGPPERIAEFLDGHDLGPAEGSTGWFAGLGDDDPERIDDGDRRYREKRFTSGDELTVYATAEPADGDTIAPDNLRLSGDGYFFVSTDPPEKGAVRSKLILGAIALAAGSFSTLMGAGGLGLL
jgi:hypothetical protein